MIVTLEGVEDVRLHFEERAEFSKRVIAIECKNRPLCLVTWENGIADVRVEGFQDAPVWLSADDLVKTILSAKQMIEDGLIERVELKSADA